MRGGESLGLAIVRGEEDTSSGRPRGDRGGGFSRKQSRDSTASLLNIHDIRDDGVRCGRRSWQWRESAEGYSEAKGEGERDWR